MRVYRMCLCTAVRKVNRERDLQCFFSFSELLFALFFLNVLYFKDALIVYSFYLCEDLSKVCRF